MKALTVRQPWAWAIFHHGKNIENRTRNTKHRGLLAIHAGKQYDTAALTGGSMASVPGARSIPADEYGAIIGVVEVVDCVPADEAMDNLWAIDGMAHWVLENPRTIEPIPCKGALGLWVVPDGFARRIEWELNR